jgi:hypothetical protein
MILDNNDALAPKDRSSGSRLAGSRMLVRPPRRANRDAGIASGQAEAFC